MSKKKKKRQPKRKAARPPVSPFAAELRKAESFEQRRQWAQARELLERLARGYPHREEVLAHLLNVYENLRDVKQHRTTCERLLSLRPNDPDLALRLAAAYAANDCLVLALRTFQQFLDRWPNHPRAGEVRTTAVSLEATVKEMLSGFGLSGEDGLQVAGWNEEVQCLVEQEKYAQAHEVAERLLVRRPDFAPVLNNISEAYYREGRLDQAIASVQRVLGFAPENYHALSNLTRFLLLSGRVAEAQAAAQRLKALPSREPAVWIKKAEALSYLGDDEGVLEALEGAESGSQREPHPTDYLLYHLAAVAACRLGREDEARRYWQESLRRQPGFEVVQQNVNDLRQPVAKRHAPWAFPISQWVLLQTIDELSAHLKPAALQKNDAAVTQEAQHFLQTHPAVAALVPVLLDRGDPQAREFALRLALMAETPEMLSALRDFALSQRGPDEVRMRAAQAVTAEGLVPSGPVRMWIEGEWRDMLLFGFELYEEPSRAHPPQVEEWGSEAMEALHAGDPVRAERLFQKALTIEPDAPDLMNNLAVAYQLQGRFPESVALLRQVFERHPDYLFARTGMARLHIQQGELDKAEALLKPLLSLRRLHYTEFAALVVAQMDLLLARGHREGARSWLEMWERGDPHHPGLIEWRQRLRETSWRRRLSRWLS